MHHREGRIRHHALRTPGRLFARGPGGDKPAGTGEGVRYAYERRQQSPSARGFRKETGTRHLHTPARHGALRLQGQAVGDQNGAPTTPWRSINLGTKPAGNEGARVAMRAPPKSALDGLITCGSCGQPMLLDGTQHGQNKVDPVSWTESRWN